MTAGVNFLDGCKQLPKCVPDHAGAVCGRAFRQHPETFGVGFRFDYCPEDEGRDDTCAGCQGYGMECSARWIVAPSRGALMGYAAGGLYSPPRKAADAKGETT